MTIRYHRQYKPGEIFKWQVYEFIAIHLGASEGCDKCIGDLSNELCDALPLGCHQD